MRVYEAITDVLVEHGVGAVFTVPANEIMHILIHAEARGVGVYRARHEHAAIGMADGFARVSGQLGVALVGKGPGLTNGINALVTARKAGTPVILIAGDAFTSAATDPHVAIGYTVGKKNVDQSGFLAALGIPAVTLTSGASAAAEVAAAIEVARSTGAIAVLIPEDVVRAEAGFDGPRGEVQVSKPTFPSAAPEQIAAVADLLEETWAASRPVILAGRGAVLAGARSDLMRVGDAIGALYATSLAAKGLFAGDPWDIGIAGTMSTVVASELLSRGDIVLAFGASLGPFTTMAGDLFRHARILRVDTEPTILAGAKGEVVPIVGDAGHVAAQLATELVRRGVSHGGYRSEYTAARITEDRRAQSELGAGDPRALVAALDRVLPAPRSMIIDTGAHLAVSGKYLSASDPADLLLPSEYSSVGAAQPVALGACVARPDRATVLVLGDGAFMMTLADIDTAVRYGLRLIVLVMNNGGFAAEYQNLQLDAAPTGLSVYANPDFASVARGLGADGVAVARLEDLHGLRARLADRSGPVVVDVKLPINAESDLVGISHRMHRAATG